MTLSLDMSRAFHTTSLSDLPEDVIGHARTVLLDALACIFAGRRTEIADIARRAALPVPPDGRGAAILPDGPQSAASTAALVNGAMLRSLDLLDVYVSVDVCHPSEAIPAALACAEARRATGREFFETVIAALALHCRLATVLPLHGNRLHHVGHAAWVVPLVAGRLMGLDANGSANALNLSSRAMFVPEGFGRGQVANFKALAYPVLARQAIDLAELAEAGLRAQPEACEEALALFNRATGLEVSPEALTPHGAALAPAITLKAYPAQYALQPIIAAGARFAAANPARVADIARIRVRASQRTVARTADREKFRPASGETADHSLPFCLAVALVDGDMTPGSLSTGRWRDADVLALIDRMEVEAVEDAGGFAIGRQDIELTFVDGASVTLECAYPGEQSWAEIAEKKLRTFAGAAVAEAVIEVVERIEEQPDIRPLIAAMRGLRS